MKAQGAAEFLTIFAIVLLLSLIVVSVVGSQASSSQDASDSESRIYWTSTAKPLQVQSGSSAYGALCQQEGKGGYELLVKNADPSSVRVTGVEIDGEASAFCEGNGAQADSVDFAPYARKFIGVITSGPGLPCEEGRPARLMLRFSYMKDSIAKSQEGTRQLVASCANNAPGQFISTSPAGSAME